MSYEEDYAGYWSPDERKLLVRADEAEAERDREQARADQEQARADRAEAKLAAMREAVELFGADERWKVSTLAARLHAADAGRVQGDGDRGS